jgi:cytochrome c556
MRTARMGGDSMLVVDSEKAMQVRPRILVLFISAFACWVSAGAADHDTAANSNLQMSAELQKLFQQEMLALLTGTQTIAASLPVANWGAIAETSATIRHSYVLEKKVTRAQEDELSRLPSEFKSLDETFHLRAEKLERAAVARDAEAVAFQFSRLLESCTDCHAKYAQARFPAFGTTLALTSKQSHTERRSRRPW